jgi:hypothetical protein
MILPAILRPSKPPVILVDIPRSVIIARETRDTPEAKALSVTNDTGAEIVGIGEYAYVEQG